MTNTLVDFVLLTKLENNDKNINYQNEVSMNMKMAIIVFVAVLGLGVSAAAGETTLLKRTIYVTPQKFLRYWKTPKAPEPVYNTNSWYPNVAFQVLGPIESGSKITVEFDHANGTPWMTVKMDTPTLEDDVLETIKPESIGSDIEEKNASIETGTFIFRIKMKNALAGTDKVLFSGKFKVGQLALDQNIPENKGKKEFMVDYDWMLPVGYVWVNPVMDADVPVISTQVCFKGKLEDGKIEAYLFYNGKQISKTVSTGNSTTKVLTSGADEPHHRYSILQFDFNNVRAFNRSASMNDYSQNFFIDKNPGSYEIKILRNNQPARNISFSVGKDGKIVDNGVASSAKLGGVRMIFPAKIAGALDGTFNAAAWQTDALFGNPLQGFVVP